MCLTERQECGDSGGDGIASPVVRRRSGKLRRRKGRRSRSSRARLVPELEWSSEESGSRGCSPRAPRGEVTLGDFLPAFSAVCGTRPGGSGGSSPGRPAVVPCAAVGGLPQGAEPPSPADLVPPWAEEFPPLPAGREGRCAAGVLSGLGGPAEVLVGAVLVRLECAVARGRLRRRCGRLGLGRT